MSEWITNIATHAGRYIVVDAAGVMVDHVAKARETDTGVEVVVVMTTDEGDELVGSRDDGQTYEPLQATVTVPGGMIISVDVDEVE